MFVSPLARIKLVYFRVTHSVVESKRGCMYTIFILDLIKMCGNEVFHPSRVP